MEQVNEGSTWYLPITFKDKDGAQAAPDSATWEVHDVRTGTVLQAATAIVPIGAGVEITVPPAVNRVVNDRLASEKHIVTIKASYGAADAVNDEYEFEVINLAQVSS